MMEAGVFGNQATEHLMDDIVVVVVSVDDADWSRRILIRMMVVRVGSENHAMVGVDFLI